MWCCPLSRVRLASPMTHSGLSLTPAPVVARHNRSGLRHGTFLDLGRPRRIVGNANQGQRSLSPVPQRVMLIGWPTSKRELDDTVTHARDVARNGAREMFGFHHDTFGHTIHRDKKQASVAGTTERKSIDGVATLRIKLLVLVEHGKHSSADNSGTDVVHLKSSQFTGRHSWPSHQVALAFEEQK